MKNTSGRSDDSLTAGIERANDLISELGERDGVDTAAYGFMVRKAGAKSLAIHRGLHPSEHAVGAAQGSRDPRVPKAQVGLSLSGSLKEDLRRDIRQRHDELVRLHRWREKIIGSPRSEDFQWDPVLLALLRMGQVDLDDLVARGPSEFANAAGGRDHAGVDFILETHQDDDTAYLACIDGDAVRALKVRYAPGIFYSWRREQPAHVELFLTNRKFPETVVHGLRSSMFSTVVGHPSLSTTKIESVAVTGGNMSLKASTNLVRP